MAKRILVPVDRSPLAESILPLVADVARGGGGTVRLMHVAPLPDNVVSKEGRLVAYADQEMTRLEAEGVAYLRTLESHLHGAPADSVVRFGEPLEEILREAEAFGADLIAVTTAGRSGMSRMVLGSVADQVFRKSPVPVVLFHPGRTGQAA